MNEVKEIKKEIRNRSINIKITQSEFSMLKRIAKKMNKSRTQLIADMLIDKNEELLNANKK